MTKSSPESPNDAANSLNEQDQEYYLIGKLLSELMDGKGRDSGSIRITTPTRLEPCYIDVTADWTAYITRCFSQPTVVQALQVALGKKRSVEAFVERKKNAETTLVKNSPTVVQALQVAADKKRDTEVPPVNNGASEAKVTTKMLETIKQKAEKMTS